MGYSEALEAQVAALEHAGQWQRDDGRDYVTERQVLVTILEEADPYYWASPMCELIQGSAESIPENWQWHPEMLPGRMGFFWFSRPLIWETGVVRNDRFVPQPTVRLRSIGWGTGTLVGTDTTVLHAVGFANSHHHVHPVATGTLRLGQTIGERLADGSLEGEHLSSVGCLLTTVASCLTFLSQRILVAPQQRAERHARKRLEAQGYQHEPLIRIVELRRRTARSETHGDADPVDWSHRWVVSGHWRQQWYETLGTHQPRWVGPYVKGPPDKPLKPPRAKIFAVTR